MDIKNRKNSSITSGIHSYKPAAWLRITGEDALSFLQGQFTQELRPERNGPAAYGLWLNQKGKVLADSFVIRVGPAEVWLFSYFSSAVVLQERLESYIIADDVVIENLTHSWRAVSIWGEAAQRGFGEVDWPSSGSFTRVGEGFMFRGRRGFDPCWEWLFPGSLLPDQTELSVVAVEMELARIQAGIPAVPTDVGPTDLPNEGGLDESAVSYTKGCYLGQEVMARLKAMGRVRRKLLRVAGEGVPPAPLPLELWQGGRKMGELRSVVADGTGGFLGLAMVTLMGLDAVQPLEAGRAGGVDIRILDTP